MKKLTTIIALFFAVTAFGQKRCFIIGYTAIESKSGTTWAGGYDTCMAKYPNLYEFISIVERRYNINSVRVLSITELSSSDRSEFYRKISPKPSPVPVLDTIPPIPDSVLFMSKKHIQLSYKNLETKLKGLENQLTVAQYNKIIEGIDAAFQELISVATEEYNRKKKAK